ncbi:MAG: DUF2207 domain-containing protein [Ginsengibacter sp.]
MRKMRNYFILVTFVIFLPAFAWCQEYYVIRNYHVDIKVNEDASLLVTETLNVNFTEPRHGIYRKIKYRYSMDALPANAEKADAGWHSGKKRLVQIDNIKVENNEYEINNENDYKVIKIGSKDKLVAGEQNYVIHYRVRNAINFFKDYSEFYYNLTGNETEALTQSFSYSIQLYQALPATPGYFVATGTIGSKDNNSTSKWINNQTLEGTITQPLKSYEGITVGIRFPKDFLKLPDYKSQGIAWLLLPLFIFFIMYFIWKRWGKDESVTIQTEFYPPAIVNPSVAGYIFDNKLNKRDLTSLIPYWGAAGNLKIQESKKESFFGLVKTRDYEFIKIKKLPESAYKFERTFFNGLFKSGDNVHLSDLKDVFYITMQDTKKQLEKEIDQDDYYVKYSRGFVYFFFFFGIFVMTIGIATIINEYPFYLWKGSAIIISGIIVAAFGLLMSKRTPKGTLLYKQLAGFREFLVRVEKDRLNEFLKQDPQYFDKVLPYAIVFNIAVKWKDKLEGLDVPPPSWYASSFYGNNFTTHSFLNSLDHSMSSMSQNFYSTPPGSGSSGGSFGGGGFSGGGFGGGGSGSW